MSLDLDNFLVTVDRRFWKHITEKSLIPIDYPLPTREDYLRDVYSRITRMDYVPGAPRSYVVSSKSNGVARFIPIFGPRDYCVYYFCVKSIESVVALNRTPGTFGGFQLGGPIRRLESVELEEAAMMDDSGYGPPTAFNSMGWRTAWSEFQLQARSLYASSEFSWFSQFDVANFYDSIRIDLLENQVRGVMSREQSDVVDLMFYFLRNSERRFPEYSPRSQGIPQDEVGDCSRILANFYLSEYDELMSATCQGLGARYLRYADDQIVACPSEHVAREIIYRSSKLLNRYGLNLNAHKVRCRDREAFAQYWAFDIFSLLNDDPPDVESALEAFDAQLRSRREFRKTSVIKRLLGLEPELVEAYIGFLADLITVEDEVTNYPFHYLIKCFARLPSLEARQRFVDRLLELSSILMCSEYHLNVIKFAQQVGVAHDDIVCVERDLARLETL